MGGVADPTRRGHFGSCCYTTPCAHHPSLEEGLLVDAQVEPLAVVHVGAKPTGVREEMEEGVNVGGAEGGQNEELACKNRKGGAQRVARTKSSRAQH